MNEFPPWETRRLVKVRRCRPQPGALERVRQLAYSMRLEYGHNFHEIAMADPFEAEALFEKLTDGVLAELGLPKTVKQYRYESTVSPSGVTVSTVLKAVDDEFGPLRRALRGGRD